MAQLSNRMRTQQCSAKVTIKTNAGTVSKQTMKDKNKQDTKELPVLAVGQSVCI